MIKLNYNEPACLDHYKDVKELLLIRIPGILNNGIIKNGANHRPDRTMINYLTSLRDDPNQIKMLVTTQPAEMRGIYETLNRSNANFFIKDTPSNLILRNLFVDHAYKNMDKLQLIKRVNVDTCPYCNRNYIYHLSKNGLLKPQIDHFYPSSSYPIFALSFYNLIPSCQTCNGFGAKEENDPIAYDLTNPYLMTNKEFRFTYQVKHINVINPLANKNSVEVKFLHKLDGHLTIFKLDKLYAQHTDHVLELLLKSKVKYVESYRKVLQSFEGVDFNDDEIDRMILGNYAQEGEMHKRPFAKLYREIGIDLGLIKDGKN